jgi:hypothetical protein
MQRVHDAFLVRGRELGEHLVLFDQHAQFVVAQVLDLAAEHDVAGLDAHVAADLARDQFVVARQHLHRHAVLGQRAQCGRGRFLRWIEKGHVAQQREPDSSATL